MFVYAHSSISMCAVRLSYTLSSGFCCVCRRPSGITALTTARTQAQAQAVPGIPPSYIMSPQYVPHGMCRLRAMSYRLILITGQLALDGGSAT